jgi:nucleotide-binding universal stress UspA family protein
VTVQVRRILVPLDFSEHADSVLEWAVHLAQEHASEVVLLHAYHPPVEFQQLEGAYLPPDFWSNVKREAEQTLERHADRVRAAGLACDVLVREGYPATVIEEAAGELAADLIVIGTRGHTGLKHLLLGSIAERVVQKAPCAVLTVKPGPKPA